MKRTGRAIERSQVRHWSAHLALHVTNSNLHGPRRMSGDYDGDESSGLRPALSQFTRRRVAEL